MKILITGAAGGIGSTLGYELSKNGHQLVLIDNFRNGYRENLTIDGETFGEFHEIDIRNYEEVCKIFEKNDIEIVIHLAAITSLPDCEINKSECIDINVIGTLNILKASKRFNVKNFIFSSTSAVYEKNAVEQAPYGEELFVNPTLFYSLSKKMAEDICRTYVENYGLNVQILRFFNVFGPRQDIHRKTPPLINYIVKCLLSNEAPVLHSDGNQARDYIYVKDVVNIIDKMIESNTSTTLNLCSGKLLTVNEIFSIIQNTLQSSIVPIFRDSSNLWDSYQVLFDDGLKRDIVAKETEKFCLGDNSKLDKIYSIDTDYNKTISETVNEIKKIYK